jgi:hypothetical protein
LEEKMADAAEIFRDAKAHYVVDLFVSLPAAAADIERRLEQAAGMPAT